MKPSATPENYTTLTDVTQPGQDLLWRTTHNLRERERIGINRSCPRDAG